MRFSSAASSRIPPPPPLLLLSICRSFDISNAAKQQKPSRDYCRVPSRAWPPPPPGLPFVHDPFFVFLEADCGVFLKYRPGVVPRVFRNIEIKALGVLQPASKATCVIFAPSASSLKACSKRSCCLHFPNVI